MGAQGKPEDPIEEFVFWQEHRYSWPIRWGPPSFLRLSRTNTLLWPYYLLMLGGLLLVAAVLAIRQRLLVGSTLGSILGLGFLGLLGVLLLYGGISWLIASHQRRPASRQARPPRRAR